jgi:hypothetical protein
MRVSFQVRALVPGGPAFRCGAIQVGDVLTHVDGISVSFLSIGQLTNLMLGCVERLCPRALIFSPAWNKLISIAEALRAHQSIADHIS